MCSRARSRSLTPVITAPLEQLRDTRRKDSSTALKLMAATGDSEYPQNWTVDGLSGTSHWIPTRQPLIKLPELGGREPHSLPLFIYPRPPPDSRPPPSACLKSLYACLLRSIIILFTPMRLTDTHTSTCRSLQSEQTSGQGRG